MAEAGGMMGGRDHTEQCPKCRVWCGGLDNAPCACDTIPVEGEASQHERQEATWRDECMRLRADLSLADAVIQALCPHLGRLPLRAEVFDALNRYDVRRRAASKGGA